MDVVLVNTNTKKAVLLMSDAGGRFDLTGANITFEDGASSFLPDEAQIIAGSYKPIDFTPGTEPADSFPADANLPTTWANSLSAFAGENPNGTWMLYVVDDNVVDGGSIASWTLNVWTTPTLTITNPAVAVDEDSAKEVFFQVADSDTADLNTLNISLSGGTNNLASYTFNGSGANRSVTMTPKANFNGVITVTVNVADGISTTSSDIQLTVNAVNDAPAISFTNNVVSLSQAGSAVAFAKVEDVDNSASALKLYALSSNPSVVAASNVFFTAEAADGVWRRVLVTPNGAAFGSATLTIQVVDESIANKKLTNSATLNVTVTEVAQGVYANAKAIQIADGGRVASTVNVAGTITGLVGRVTITLADVNHTNPEDLDVVLVKDKRAVVLMGQAGGSFDINEAYLTFSDTAENDIPEGQVTRGAYRPKDYNTENVLPEFPADVTFYANLDGFQGVEPKGDWTLFVYDRSSPEGGKIENGWTLSIYPAPTIGAIADVTIDEDQSTSVTFEVKDWDGKVDSLAATSANSGLVTATASLNGTVGKVDIGTKANANGTTTISVVATDNKGFTATRTFNVKVNPVNDAPTINPIAKVVTSAGVPVGPVSFIVNDVDNDPGALTLSASSTDTTLLPVNNIVFGGLGQDRTVTLFPVGSRGGNLLVTITVSDGKLTSNTTFEVNVNEAGNPLILNTTPITITDNSTATPYPSPISVSGLKGKVAEVQVALLSVTHPGASDLDVLLVGPNGRQVLLMSDAGGATPLSNAQLIFRDGTNQIAADSITSGTYRPTDYETGDVFANMPLTNLFTTLTDAFDNIDPNGTWQLYVVDDNTAVRGGVIGGGWMLSIRTRPVISPAIADVAVNEDNVGRVSFNIGDAQPGVTLKITTSYTGSPSDLINKIDVSGTGATRDLAITPNSDRFGANLVTVTVTDERGISTSDTFEFKVNAVNDSPRFRNVADDYTTPAATPIAINFKVEDAWSETDPEFIEVSAISSDTTLVPGTLVVEKLSTDGYRDRRLVIQPAGILSRTANITLTATDGNNLKGSKSFRLNVVTNVSSSTSQPIQITERGAGSPYPSVVRFSGIDGLVSKVTVILEGFHHTFPADVDVLLVSPDNKKVVLMSDVGGGIPGTPNPVRLTFTDAGASIPADTAPVSGVYKPTNVGDEDFTSPAPAGPYSTSLATFVNSSPNGEWKLFVQDDDFGESGAIDGGWILILETTPIISTIPDLVTQEDKELVVPFTVADSDTADLKNLKVDVSITGTPSDLIAKYAWTTNAGIRSITLYPKTNTVGSNFVTLTVTDNAQPANSSSESFGFTVTPVDDAPTIKLNITGVAVTNVEDTVTTLTYTIEDIDSTIGASNVVVTSSNENLVPNNFIAWADVNRTSGGKTDVSVSVTNVANQSGNTELTFTLTDRNSTVALPVTLYVTAVNDMPTLSQIPPHAVTAGTSTTNINYTISDIETSSRNLTVGAFSLNQAVVPDNYIKLGGSGDTRTIQVTTIGTAGDLTATIRYWVSDGNLSKTNSFDVTTVRPDRTLFANTEKITIRDNTTATPYPSKITVSGMVGSVRTIRVMLDGFKHTNPDNVDMLLVGPGGTRKVILMSDVGDSNPVTNGRLLFDDTGRVMIDGAAITDGTYAPSNNGADDTFANPAPAGPYGSTLSTFAGISPNGDWELYVQDDTSNGTGEISFGWSLEIETAPLVTISSPAAGILSWPEDSNASFTINVQDNVITDPNSLVYTIASSNPTLIPPGNVVKTGVVGNEVTFSVQPSRNQFGTNTLTVTVKRPDGVSSSISFGNDVTPVNDAPTVSRLTSKTMFEGALLDVPVIVNDLDTVLTNLSVEVSSSNQNAINNTNLFLFGTTNFVASLTAEQIPFTLRASKVSQPETTTITLTIRDKADAAMPPVITNFVVVVGIINDAPLISAIADQPAEAGITTPKVQFTVSDIDEGSILTITKSSSDQSLVKNANIIVYPAGSTTPGSSGPTGNWAVEITPEPGVQVGSSAQITLTVTDNGSTPMSATTRFMVNILPTRERTFENNSTILIPLSGAADPYPSSITVTGLVGNITKAVVKLKGITHSYPSDVDVLLVSPTGQKVMLMSDAGAGTGVVNVTNTFDDAASAISGALVNGTYKPTNIDDGTADSFLPPAPNGTYSADLSAFNGQQPNGEWKLFVFDDTAPDSGAISNGWSLTLKTTPVINNLADVTVDEDNTARSSFTIAEESFVQPPMFSFGFSSTNTALVPNPSTNNNNIRVEGNGLNWTVFVTPLANAFGTTEITVWVTNAHRQVISDKFLVTVRSVNDTPTIDPIANQAIPAGGWTLPLGIAYRDIEDGENLTLTVESSDTSIIPLHNIIVVGKTVTVFAKDDGGSSRITLRVADKGNPALSATTSFLVNVVEPLPALFANEETITINNTNAATPYPSTVVVSDMKGQVSEVTVTLAQLSHQFPDDLDILLVGPQGQKVVLMSDVGGNGMLTNVRLTFKDSAESSLPNDAGISTGTFKPTNNNDDGQDVFAAPAPAAPYANTLSAFNGTDPNGTWSLYIVDDASPDAGSIVGGWMLNIKTTAPVLTELADQELVEDTAKTITFSVADGNNSANDLSVSAIVSDAALLSASVNGSGSERSLTLTPAANAVGSGTVTLLVTDGANTNEVTFNVTVTAVNDAPAISGLANTTTPANVDLQGQFTVSDVDNDAASLAVSASVDNAEIGTVTVSGSGSTRTLVFMPNRNAAVPANATITVIVSDGALSATNSIVVGVTAKIGPQIADIAPQSMFEDETLDVPLAITSPSGNATVTGAASNPALVSGVQIVDNGGTKVARITLVPDASGSSSIEIIASDEYGQAKKTFGLTVVPVNDAPAYVSTIADVVTPKNVPVEVQIAVADKDTALEGIRFEATSSKPSLVTGISFRTEDSKVIASINVASNQTGVAAIVVRMSDGGPYPVITAFALEVRDVHYAPTLGPIADQETNEDEAKQIGLVVADADTALESLTFSGSSSDSALVRDVKFVVSGSAVIATVTPVANQSGSATVTISVGDATTTVSQSFRLTVKPVADDFALGAIGDVQTLEDVPAVIVLSVDNPDSANLTFTGSSSNPNLVSGVSFAKVGNDTVATVNLVANSNGIAMVTISATDGAKTSAKSFTLQVQSVKDSPILGVINNQTTVEDLPIDIVLDVTDPDTAIGNLTFTGTSAKIGTNENVVTAVKFEKVDGKTVAVVNLSTNKTGKSLVTITVSDGETTPATRTFEVNVKLPRMPQMAAKMEGSTFKLTVTGDAGSSYIIQATSDLVNWTNVGEVYLDETGSKEVSIQAGENNKYFRATNK